MINNDTIAAISTPLTGESGIGIVRLSGVNAVSIAEKIFLPKGKKKLSAHNTFTVHYGWITDSGKKIVDEVLVTVMYAPRTYTKEDITEISCHGGPVILRRILEICIENGARLAEPGEFTRRAFLNGRIDLVQAEAVCDLISSKTDRSAVIAAGQVKGALSEKLNAIKNGLIDLVSMMEALIDYPEDDTGRFNEKKFLKQIKQLADETEKLAGTALRGKIYRNGIKVAITGKPNAGKSSLMNRLVSEERSIVTPIAGTTRDVVSEIYNLKGIPVTIMDTAGIRFKYRKTDYIDKLAKKKSESTIVNADFILCLCDASTELSENDLHIFKIINESRKKTLLVFNKIDLVKNRRAVTALVNKYRDHAGSPGGAPYCLVSVKEDTGIDKLEDMLHRMVIGRHGNIKTPDTSDNAVVTNIRHENLLKECARNLRQASESILKGESIEFVVFHLKKALDNLAEITGKVTADDILDRIFSRFCIGK